LASVKSYTPGKEEKAWVTAASIYLLLHSAMNFPVQCPSNVAVIALAVAVYLLARSYYPIFLANKLATSNECP